MALELNKLYSLSLLLMVVMKVMVMVMKMIQTVLSPVMIMVWNQMEMSISGLTVILNSVAMKIHCLGVN